MKYIYYPKGVCSTKMEFEIEGNIIKDMKITDGCNGNTQGLSALIKGQNIDEVISKIDGIKCGRRPTSCPDQVAQALKAYKNEQIQVS